MLLRVSQAHTQSYRTISFFISAFNWLIWDFWATDIIHCCLFVRSLRPIHFFYIGEFQEKECVFSIYFASWITLFSLFHYLSLSQFITFIVLTICHNALFNLSWHHQKTVYTSKSQKRVNTDPSKDIWTILTFVSLFMSFSRVVWRWHMIPLRCRMGRCFLHRFMNCVYNLRCANFIFDSYSMSNIRKSNPTEIAGAPESAPVYEPLQNWHII